LNRVLGIGHNRHKNYTTARGAQGNSSGNVSKLASTGHFAGILKIFTQTFDTAQTLDNSSTRSAADVRRLNPKNWNNKQCSNMKTQRILTVAALAAGDLCPVPCQAKPWASAMSSGLL
jgi:hypothetical protein